MLILEGSYNQVHANQVEVLHRVGARRLPGRAADTQPGGGMTKGFTILCKSLENQGSFRVLAGTIAWLGIGCELSKDWEGTTYRQTSQFYVYSTAYGRR